MEMGNYFLIVIAFIWILFAVVQDLRKREVANWVNFSLFGIAVFYKLINYLSNGNYKLIWFAFLGILVFFVLSNLFYYSGIFGGGDAKLLIALGAVLPFESYFDFIGKGGGFIVSLFIIGAIYSLIYSVYIVKNNKKKFILEFKHKMGLDKFYIFLAGVIAIGLIFLINPIVLGFLFALLIVFLPFLYIYLKSLEECMVEIVSSKKLTEGDWIYEDIKIGRRVIKKDVDGLSAEDIALLRKYNKKVLVKKGIPFTPAFLFAFIIMVFFSEALLQLMRALLFF